MNLRQYIIRVQETGGLMRQANIRALRDYLRSQPDIGLVREIKGLETSRQLRVLWEAGLSAALQKATTDRLEELS